MDEQQNLLGFGQCYELLQRCHLGRLVVNPAHRGQGLVAALMVRLIDFGANKFNAREASLFVLEDTFRFVCLTQIWLRDSALFRDDSARALPLHGQGFIKKAEGRSAFGRDLTRGRVVK